MYDRLLLVLFFFTSSLLDTLIWLPGSCHELHAVTLVDM